MKQIPIPIYLMPGMAASPRIFEFISLPDEFEVIKLSWMTPKKRENLNAYAQRMCGRITHKNPVLLGVSFGGILVQEMAKIITCRQVIVVSSVKTKMELSTSMKLAKKTGAHKLLPTQWIKSLESLALFVFGPSIRPKVEAYQKYLSERDPAYLDWCIHNIVYWEQTQFDPNVIHIHGDKDIVFPIENLDTSQRFYRLNGATHAMILTHHKWFNEHLPKFLLMQAV